MRFHKQNLNDKPGGRKGSILRNGRAWFSFFSDRYQINWEWVFFVRYFGLRFGVDRHDDCPWSFSIHTFLFSIYLSLNSPLLRKLTPNTKDCDSREIELEIRDWSLWWNFWTSDSCWSSRTPKWRNGCFHFIDFLLGKEKHSKRKLSGIDTFVPMPEKAYPCTVEMFEATWKRPRWFPKRLIRADIDIPEGVPFPGKGENSWDCGEDAIFSMSCVARTVPEAIGKIVSSCLSDRQKYGTLDYVPEGMTAGRNE